MPIHPLALAQRAAAIRTPADPAYARLQAEGSAWSRWTAYGSRAVWHAREAAGYFLGDPPTPEGKRIMCAGCNDGLEMEPFARMGFLVEGFDLDPEKVRVAVYCGLSAKVGDLHSPPGTDGIYDGVFCCHTLEHVIDRPLACRGLGNLLRGGGVLYLVVPLETAFPSYNPSHTGWWPSAAAVLEHFEGWPILLNREWTNPPGYEEVGPQRQVTLALRKPTEAAREVSSAHIP